MINLTKAIDVRLRELRDQYIISTIPLLHWEIRTAKHTGPNKYENVSDWRRINTGDVWGWPGQTVFFRCIVDIPESWDRHSIGIKLKTGGEGLLYINGIPYHGVDDNRSYILLPATQSQATIQLDMEMRTSGCWEWINEGQEPTTGSVLSCSQLVLLDKEMESAYFDFLTATKSANAVQDPTLKKAILTAIKNGLYFVDFRNKDTHTFKDQVLVASKGLKQRLLDINFSDTSAKVFFTGHSHIDVAWLWPLKETIRKCGRTYSTVMALMDEYPNYYFNCSQVPLFTFTREHYPAVYQKIKQRVKEGRFEPIGGTFVEHDTNLISGESIVRQCLYGQRFFEKEFGKKIRVGWLPDVFGYTWSLPQIYKKAGIDYFVTSKISWNDTNKVPLSTLWWEGIDGSRLFTQFILGTYNGAAEPDQILKMWESNPLKLECPEFISSFGHGDGGGGPTREMIEMVSRLSDMPGIPKATTGLVHDYFDDLVKYGDILPVWNDELYLEYHRGTYTSQAKIKKGNRRSELTLRDAELMGALVSKYGFEYDRVGFQKNWERVLLNQFHDILPGSSVNEVYREAEEQYRSVNAFTNEKIHQALSFLSSRIDTQGRYGVVVFNTLSWDRVSIASVDLEGDKGNFDLADENGCKIPSFISEGKINFLAKVPALGYRVYYLVERDIDKVCETPFQVNGLNVKTPYYSIKFGTDGSIEQLYDNEFSREVIASGCSGNILQFFEDKPSVYEAWEIEPHYKDKMWCPDVEKPLVVVENNKLRLVLLVKLKYNKSIFTQRIILYNHTRRIDFDTSVDWQERKTLLKVAFPVDIRSSKATYEIPYGAIERSTHNNTSWQQAQFEVPGHKWADLSEANYGVSILNDCKYGWDIKGNIMRLSLLRSPENPDRFADLGEHSFVYSLYPRVNDWKSGTVQESFDLNVPLHCQIIKNNNGDLPGTHSFIRLDNSFMIIDACKMAEDSGDLIVRLYEAYGARGQVRVVFGEPIKAAYECTLLEEENVKIEVMKGNTIELLFKPFELKTVKIRQ